MASPFIELLADPEFWKAIVQLAWPVSVVLTALIFRKFIGHLLKSETLKIKVAGMELSVQDAAEQAGKGVSDLQERLAILEGNFAHGPNNIRDKNSKSMGSLLWVDDFPSNNAFIIQKLESEGIRIRKELSTDAACGALAQEPFDLVISDLGRIENGRENKFAGLDFARAMRASGSEIPLLIFAGTRGLENRDKLLGAGVTQVTASPVDVFRFVEGTVPRSD